MGQGFGLFGMGILVDFDGNDRYIINGLGQGAGSTMGFGGLCDLSGDDDYNAGGADTVHGRLKADDWVHAQGVGLIGPLRQTGAGTFRFMVVSVF